MFVIVWVIIKLETDTDEKPDLIRLESIWQGR